MLFLLATAEAADTSNSGILIVLLSVGVTILAAGFALVPMLLARAGRHPQAEVIAAVAILWALLAAGSVVTTSMAQMKWDKERLMRIESGYYDPQDNTDAPAKPWGAWAGLGAGYAVLLVWSVAMKRPPIAESSFPKN
jgi:flagellar basal body-associated protein FliL